MGCASSKPAAVTLEDVTIDAATWSRIVEPLLEPGAGCAIPKTEERAITLAQLRKVKEQIERRCEAEAREPSGRSSSCSVDAPMLKAAAAGGGESGLLCAPLPADQVMLRECRGNAFRFSTSVFSRAASASIRAQPLHASPCSEPQRPLRPASSLASPQSARVGNGQHRRRWFRP